MKLHQTSCNQFKCKLLKEMNTETNSVRAGVRSWVPLMEAMEECEDQSDFKETTTEAVDRVICKPCPSVASNPILKDLCHVKCVCHKSCPHCPSFKMPTAEKKCTDSISFQSHQCVHTCSECGTLDEGSTECQLCSTKRDGEKIGKVRKQRHLVHLERTF